MYQCYTNCYFTHSISAWLGCAIIWSYPFLLSNALKLITVLKKQKNVNAAIVIAYLLLQLVKYEFYDDIILEPQYLCHPLSNPRFDDFQVHFGHVHLGVTQATWKAPS